MAGINRVAISGNLVRDPDLKSTQSGSQVMNFCMAVNDRRKNPSTGEYEDYANFVDVVLFGNRCDFFSKRLRKGSHVFVEGKLRYTSWERDGQRRSKLEVVAEEIDFERQRDGQQQPAYQPQQQQYHPQQPYQPQPADDGIPF